MSYDAPPPSAMPPSYGGGSVPPHPKSTTILILGIVGLVCCQILAPVAWIMGNSAMKEIQAGQYAEDSGVKIGRILGIVGTVLWVLGIILWIVLLSTGFMSMEASTSTSGF